jgi:hypothetical protein
LLVDDYSGRISRDLWWKNQEINPVDITVLWFSILTYQMGMNNRPVGGLTAETWSHPIDMIIIKVT